MKKVTVANKPATMLNSNQRGTEFPSLVESKVSKMRTVQFGDIVKIGGMGNGRSGEVVKIDEDGSLNVMMGTYRMCVTKDQVTIIARSRWDRDGNRIEPKLEIGDSVQYTYPNPSVDNDNEQAVRYGNIVEFISDKRVNILWYGSDTPKAERISRIKWVPMIPGSFIREYNSF